jgi:hypothetical protein
VIQNWFVFWSDGSVVNKEMSKSGYSWLARSVVSGHRRFAAIITSAPLMLFIANHGLLWNFGLHPSHRITKIWPRLDHDSWLVICSVCGKHLTMRKEFWPHNSSTYFCQCSGQGYNVDRLNLVKRSQSLTKYSSRQWLERVSPLCEILYYDSTPSVL